jgi:hypothetical protein
LIDNGANVKMQTNENPITMIEIYRSE